MLAIGLFAWTFIAFVLGIAVGFLICLTGRFK
jgi:hypothetical protein